MREQVDQKVMALWEDPAFRAEMSAMMRASWARRKARLSEGETR